MDDLEYRGTQIKLFGRKFFAVKIIEIGFGNIVSAERVIAVVTPESAPNKRLVQEAKEAGLLLDETGGKKAQSVLVIDNGNVVLSTLGVSEVAGLLERCC